MRIVIDRPCRFPSGRLAFTPGVAAEIDVEELAVALIRHVQGDWGLVCEEDRLENELSLEHGFRLMSVYESSKGKRFWIITEADRSVTTVLLPEEY